MMMTVVVVVVAVAVEAVVMVVVVVVVTVNTVEDMVVATQSRTIHVRSRRHREHRECSFGSPYRALTRGPAPSAPK